MKKILISPYSRKLRKEGKNPKNFPYWTDVVAKLRERGFYIIQIGIKGEDLIGADEVKFDLQLESLKEELNDCFTWISVDNFFNHFASFYRKKGIVIFGKSDPNIFGYEENINLLKDRKYLRSNQFDIWENETYSEEVFINTDVVIVSVESIV